MRRSFGVRGLIAAALASSILTFSGLSHAQVRPVVIDDDDGGNVAQFVTWFKRLAASGVPVRFRGLCHSSCTLGLMLPPTQACIEPTASFGFHLFTYGGRFDTSMTQAYVRRYMPAGVQEWLKDKRLTPSFTYMSAAEIVEAGVLPWCEGTAPPVASIEAPAGEPEHEEDDAGEE